MKTIAVLLLFCASFATMQNAIAQEKKETPRHINFNQTLKGFDGKVIQTGGDAKSSRPMTLGDAAIVALETPIEDDRKDTGDEKFKRDMLARKIYLDAPSVVLTVEETALIKERIGKIYGPIVVGATWPLIDPATK